MNATYAYLRSIFGLRRSWIAGLTAALIVGLLNAGPAAAAPLAIPVNFETSGWVGPASSAAGPLFNPVQFMGVQRSQFLVPSALGLGSFDSAALSPGVKATYTNAPFAITLSMSPQLPTGVAEATVNYSYIIYGRLNGNFSGPNQSSVIATFDSIAPNSPSPGGAPPQPIVPNLSVTTPLGRLVLPPALAIVPSSSGHGLTSVEALMLPLAVPVPEPATLAVFAAGMAALGWRRRRKTRA